MRLWRFLFPNLQMIFAWLVVIQSLFIPNAEIRFHMLTLALIFVAWSHVVIKLNNIEQLLKARSPEQEGV